MVKFLTASFSLKFPFTYLQRSHSLKAIRKEGLGNKRLKRKIWPPTLHNLPLRNQTHLYVYQQVNSWQNFKLTREPES